MLVSPAQLFQPSLLPLEGYAWRHIRTGVIETGPGERHVFFDEYVEGYGVFVYFETDNPDTAFVLDLWGDGRLDLRLTPRFLYERGLTTPNPMSAWLALYDATSNRYVALWTPGYPVPFRGRVRAWIEGGPARSVVEVWLYERVLAARRGRGRG